MKILKWIDEYRNSFGCVVEYKDNNYLVIDDSYDVLVYSSDCEGNIQKYPEICKIEGKTISEVLRDNRSFIGNIRLWSKNVRLNDCIIE